MANSPPDYCAYCGAGLEAVDPPSVHYCESCDDHVFHNPIPTARVAVVDGAAVLLVKVDVDGMNVWGTPGGAVEGAEDPDVTGARELEEETTLTVDPADTVLFDARSFVKFGTTHKTSLCYAVDVADVAGTPEADDEVAAARFWTPDELATASDGLLTDWPEAYKDVTWWVENATAALERT